MSEIIDKIREIVQIATALKNNYLAENNFPVNYACIFSQSKDEYNDLTEKASKIGKIIKETPTGPIFLVRKIKTVSGDLKLVKIRLPDDKRIELGDADFTISDFEEFKKKYLRKKGFKIINRENYEMIELYDTNFNALAYFSNPTLLVQLKLDD